MPEKLSSKSSLRPAANSAKTPVVNQSKTRQILTGLGILVITFGILGWQWTAFNQRNAASAAEETEELPPPQTHWHEATAKVRMGVAESIRGHLSALQSPDANDLLQFHTRAVRHQFTSIAQYSEMMQKNYPIIANNRRAIFRFVNMDKEHHFANAGLTIWGADGKILNTVYSLVFQENHWLISGIAKHTPSIASSPSKKTS